MELAYIERSMEAHKRSRDSGFISVKHHINGTTGGNWCSEIACTEGSRSLASSRKCQHASELGQVEECATKGKYKGGDRRR